MIAVSPLPWRILRLRACRVQAFAALAVLAALAGCSAEVVRERGEEPDGMHDPVMTAALEGQLMVDPDLSQANMRNMAVVPAGPADPALPLPNPPKS